MKRFPRALALCLVMVLGGIHWVSAQCTKPAFGQTLTITNPNAVVLTNYVVKFTVNTSALQAAGRLTNKFGFVFYDANCVTQLDYWPSDSDAFPSSSATYYVKVPSIPASSSKKIQMMYDNATTCTKLITGTFSSIGTIATAPTVGFSAATTWEITNQTFPSNSTTFRWDVRSANTGNFQPKTTYTLVGNQYVQAEGTSRTVAIGTNNYVDELPVDAGGHPGFFTPSLLNIAANCGLCNNVNSGSGNIPPNSVNLTSNTANTAQVQVYYRPRAAAEPTVTAATAWNRNTPVTISPAGAVIACEEDFLTFTASTPFIRYRWYFDNVFQAGGTNSVQTLNTSGMSSGVHVLKVVAYHSDCDSVQATKNITINPRPDINSLTPDNGCQLDNLSFSANIGLNGSTLSNHDWSFGDATSGTGPSPNHTYLNSGSLSLRLIVTTTQNCKDTLVEPILVYPKPSVNTITEVDICWPQPVLFSNNTTIPGNWNSSTIATYDWRFGDGAAGTGSSTSHVYALPNGYTDTLVAITNFGCRDTLAGSLEVWPKPSISSLSDPNICWPQAASFSNASNIPNNWNSAAITLYDWHFGDATTGLGASTTHGYTIPGLYNDTIYVETSDACRDTLSDQISIWPKPSIDSTTAPDICWPTGQTFTGFTSIANNWNSAAITIHDWRFGDANTGSTNPAFHAYALPNTYSHTLFVETGNACRDTLVNVIDIFPKPSINNLVESDICWPDSVLYFNLTTIPNNWNGALNVAWLWKFGDGATSTDSATTHAFAIPGLYPDTLYVTTSDACMDTLTGSVDVWPKPRIDSIITADVCDPETVSFSQSTAIPDNWNSATLNVYAWDFGDGNTGTGANTTHNYASPGAYTVTLIVTTSDFCRDTLVKVVNVFPKPNATYSIADICYGDSLLLNSASTVANTLGGAIVQHDWTFGDGNGSNAINPAHWYAFDGIYTVTLVVTTNHGCMDTLIQPLNVFPKPNASFSFPTTCQPDSVQFVDASTVSSGILAQYDWAFGDGANSALANPAHAYPVADTFDVTLIVTTDHGCLDTMASPLTWNPKPLAAFSFPHICFPDSTPFQDNSTLLFGNIDTWAWDFGDGNASSQPSPVHHYAVAGTYTVSLIVVTDSSCRDTVTWNTTSNEMPHANYQPNTICWPDTVPFIDGSTIGGAAAITSWEWTFGDGDTSSLQHPMHYYMLPDTYALSLVVWSDSGCTDTLAQRFVAYPRSGLELGADTMWLCPFNDFVVHAGPQFVSYIWQDGSTDSTYFVDTVGIYTVWVTDTNGCTQGDTVQVPLAPKPVLSVVPDDTLHFCSGTQVSVDAASPTVFSYIWSTGETSSNLDIGIPGTYTVIGYNFYSCADTLDLLAIEHILPEPDLGADTSFCFGDSVLLDASGPFATWNWSNNTSSSSFLSWYGGPFVVTVTDSFGCQGADTILLTRNPLPQVDLGVDSSLCEGDIMLLDAGSGYVTYTWSTGEFSQTVEIGLAAPVFVQVTDINGCTNTSNIVNVTVDTLPAKPVITKGDEEIELVSSFQLHYQWLLNRFELAGEVAQELIPGVTGQYQVLVTDGNGCQALSDSFFIELEIFDAEMFEGISPNGDGVNDFFVVPEIEYYPDNELVIFSRWGNEVYRRSGYLNHFQGKSKNGTELNDGVYFYVLDLGNGQKPVKGYFVINR